jgi:hypothetical protein
LKTRGTNGRASSATTAQPTSTSRRCAYNQQPSVSTSFKPYTLRGEPDGFLAARPNA